MVQSTRPDSEFVYLGMGARPGLQKHEYLQCAHCAVDYSGTWRAENEAELGKNAGQRELDRKGRNRKEDCKQMKQSVRIMRKEFKFQHCFLLNSVAIFISFFSLYRKFVGNTKGMNFQCNP